MKKKINKKECVLSCDLAIVGGGLAGICAAITAARGGISVILVHDRPVLGGNASSEVRLWALGATSHMGNNNRWSREGGVIDELLTENLYRNPEGNPVIFDTVLLDKVLLEKNITLLLNTATYNCTMNSASSIKNILAFNSQNETEYIINSHLFCDCSGDGILGFLSNAKFIMGKSDNDIQDKLNYPESFGELLGSSIFFYTKDTGTPVKYIAPSFALKDISKLKRLNRISTNTQGCDYWWLEWSGTQNTIYDSEKIKYELWKIIYGIWDYIKNSGKFSDAETLTLEWVGTIPGKRESRRFIGDYLLTQADLVEQRHFHDVVSFGGWAIDHHPSDGVYSDYDPCYQWHTKGIYEIPYRCMYSKNIDNLFISGRLISTSRAAFGGTRVMLTCAHNAQAVAVAAIICKQKNITPKDITNNIKLVHRLQQHLLRKGQYIPSISSYDKTINKALTATIQTSSEYVFTGFKPNANFASLTYSTALVIPFSAGKIPTFTLFLNAKKTSTMEVHIRIPAKEKNFTPEITLEKISIQVSKKTHQCFIKTNTILTKDTYVFLCIMKNPDIDIQYSNDLLTGITTVHNKFNKKVAKSAVQNPPKNIGIDSFEFWTPYRRPYAKNIAISFSKPLSIFSKDHLTNGLHRPIIKSNSWVASTNDSSPSITLSWDSKQNLKTMLLFFDTDFDFSMESVQMQHPERVLPFCVSNYKVYNNDTNEVLVSVENNYQARNQISFTTYTKSIRIECKTPNNAPVALFGIQCW